MKPECTIENTIAPEVQHAPAAATTWSSKLQQHHFERTAVVYVRQSTPHQVLNHRESTARQYSWPFTGGSAVGMVMLGF